MYSLYMLTISSFQDFLIRGLQIVAYPNSLTVHNHSDLMDASESSLAFLFKSLWHNVQGWVSTILGFQLVDDQSGSNNFAKIHNV